MILSTKSTLRDVALVVGTALDFHRIDAVLTGGACASIHSDGAHSSLDLDFILTRSVTQSDLDDAMADAGFARDGDRYVHSEAPFWVEFPRGPLAVGGDYRIRPVIVRDQAGRVQTLSPTDSCRDRLAAFYHWHDRQSLEVALQIALRHPVRMRAIQKWSTQEGGTEQFAEFRRELARRKSKSR